MPSVHIVFASVQRDRPIVLTSHEIRKLSNSAGRDVTDELQKLAAEAFEAKTLRRLMDALRLRLGAPKTWGDVYLSKVDRGMDPGSAAYEADQWAERLTGEPHIDGWPLHSGLPPSA